MSRYFKRNRYQLAGVALPVFLLFILFTIGVSVFPGWIQSSYGTPGASCLDFTSDTNSTNLLTACDCNSEVCINNTCQVTSVPFCVTEFDTQVVSACHNICTATVVQINTEFAADFRCLANDAFCNGISGGNVTNQCRTASCDPIGTPDPANPSGCTYNLGSGVDCMLCATPAPSTFNHCGNGICEPGLGETLTSCPVDCLVPLVSPIPTPGVLNNACAIPAAAAFVTFGSGPPFNQTGSGTCEDGDICTTNICLQNGTCQTTPAICSGNIADFCCPSGCVPPASGSSCVVGAVNNCDIDCYTPQQCVQPSPTPIPTPIPTPTFSRCLQGDGLSSNRNDLKCDGFTCAFHPGVDSTDASTSGLAVLAAMGVVAGLWWRSREKKFQ